MAALFCMNVCVCEREGKICAVSNLDLDSSSFTHTPISLPSHFTRPVFEKDKFDILAAYPDSLSLSIFPSFYDIHFQPVSFSFTLSPSLLSLSLSRRLKLPVSLCFLLIFLRSTRPCFSENAILRKIFCRLSLPMLPSPLSAKNDETLCGIYTQVHVCTPC